ncbi:hypothetical protein D3C78_1381160 [compost metagenome]
MTHAQCCHAGVHAVLHDRLQHQGRKQALQVLSSVLATAHDVVRQGVTDGLGCLFPFLGCIFSGLLVGFANVLLPQDSQQLLARL